MHADAEKLLWDASHAADRVRPKCHDVRNHGQYEGDLTAAQRLTSLRGRALHSPFANSE